MSNRNYDCIVVGSGPNGLAAAITLQISGLSTLLVEAKSEIGGGMRSAELTLPHFIHDVCSAIHPMAVTSPFFKSIPLDQHGLEFIQPDIAAAHPFDDGSASVLYRSIKDTGEQLGKDKVNYIKLINPLVKNWSKLSGDILGPLQFPKYLFSTANFGIKAISSAVRISKRFRSKKAKGLWGGMAAHSLLPLTQKTTAAIALVLLTIGHSEGWPIPLGGSQSIANALASYFRSIGGNIKTNFDVQSIDQLPSSHVVLLDVTPKQLLKIAGHKFSNIYRWQLKRYQYGMGVFKIDWALSEPIPFIAEECRKAGTVHLGNTLKEIVISEQMVSEGRHPNKPFVLLAQQSLFDPTRSPKGRHTAWAYCHVPNGSEEDMTERIENQVERFAPGFRDCILGRHTMNTYQMERYNPNYIGGDINGGKMDISQLFTRPALRFSPYRTSLKGVYICSSSTPPGGGVHGMCGYHAAKRALKDVFKMDAMSVH